MELHIGFLPSGHQLQPWSLIHDPSCFADIPQGHKGCGWLFGELSPPQTRWLLQDHALAWWMTQCSGLHAPPGWRPLCRSSRQPLSSAQPAAQPCSDVPIVMQGLFPTLGRSLEGMVFPRGLHIPALEKAGTTTSPNQTKHAASDQ